MNKSQNPTSTNVGITLEPLRWLRVGEAVRTRGVSRSLLYLMIRDGKIKSSALRKKGNTRGIRLISPESLDAYIEAHVEGPPWSTD